MKVHAKKNEFQRITIFWIFLNIVSVRRRCTVLRCTYRREKYLRQRVDIFAKNNILDIYVDLEPLPLPLPLLLRYYNCIFNV